MFNQTINDWLQRIHWYEAYRFFTKGHPPLIVQLLVLNGAFLLFFLIRRLRGGYALRPKTALVVQLTLVALNVLLLFTNDFYYYYDKAYWLFFRQVF